MDTIAEAAAFFGKEIITDERLKEREKGPDGNNYGMFQKRWALIEILSDHPGKEIVVGTHGTALSTILHFYDICFGCEEEKEFKGSQRG